MPRRELQRHGDLHDDATDARRSLRRRERLDQRTCRADGTCLGIAGCAAPPTACANGTESRDGCANARVIGRQSAATMAGFTVTDNTCSARNRFDDCSWDAGNDHAYRIWMRTGEQIAVQVDLRDLCFSGFSATLKLYESTGCTDVTRGSDRWCEDFVDERVPYNYTAVRDGWIVVVVDGSTAFDDEGTYSLNVRLTGCSEAGCGCGLRRLRRPRAGGALVGVLFTAAAWEPAPTRLGRTRLGA